jgi:glycosyltransferase involved in cell wall biosynthesis
VDRFTTEVDPGSRLENRGEDASGEEATEIPDTLTGDVDGGGAKGSVWMIIPSFAPAIGGAESQVRRLSAPLMLQGWQVRVLTRRHGESLMEDLAVQERVDGIPVIRIDSRGRGRWASARYLTGSLRTLSRYRGGGIYHAHDIGTPGLIAALAKLRFGGASVVKLRTGASIYERRFGSGIRRWLFRLLLRMHDRVIVVNSELETFLHRLGLPSDRVVRIPNGVDGDTFRAVSPSQQRRARVSHGLPLEKHVVLYVGRLAHVKGVDVLLRAWAGVSEDLRDRAVLVIVGDGEERGRLEELATRLDVAASVIFAGERTEVHGFYRAADVFILPSRTEGLSNALLEAMACELPVIASDGGGSPDVVEDGRTGLLFSSENEGHLTRCLERMLRTPQAWAEMGRRARVDALEFAGFESVVRRLTRLYATIYHSD